MGISDVDYSSPPKKRLKHSSSNGNDRYEGKQETLRDFSFSFDICEQVTLACGVVDVLLITSRS